MPVYALCNDSGSPVRCGNDCSRNHVVIFVSALSFPARHGRIRAAEGRTARVDTARALGLVGVVAYNWWVVVPFVPGLLSSPNGFFSDLEATGHPDAVLMQRADLVAGVAMAAAFLLGGSMGRHEIRRERRWMVAFAAAGAVGGRFSYACAEGLSATCRQLEWRLELPLHHYIHVVSGIAEFAALTVAVILAARRTRGERTVEARVYRALVTVLAVGYPVLGAAYLTDRLGAFVEPVFFLAFSAMVVAQLFEPVGSFADARRRVHLTTG